MNIISLIAFIVFHFSNVAWAQHHYFESEKLIKLNFQPSTKNYDIQLSQLNGSLGANLSIDLNQNSSFRSKSTAYYGLTTSFSDLTSFQQLKFLNFYKMPNQKKSNSELFLETNVTSTTTTIASYNEYALKIGFLIQL